MLIVSAGLRAVPSVSDGCSQRAYLESAGTPSQSEPRGTAAAVHSPSLKPGLRRYEGGTGRHSIFKERGEQRVGGGRWGWDRERGRERQGGERERGVEGTALEPTSGSRWREFGKIPDLSPISVEIADNGDDMMQPTHSKQTRVNKQMLTNRGNVTWMQHLLCYAFMSISSVL